MDGPSSNVARDLAFGLSRQFPLVPIPEREGKRQRGKKRKKKKEKKNFFIDFAQFYFAPFYFAQFFRKNWRLSKGSRELPISEKEEKEGGRVTHQWSRLYKYL